MDYWQVVAPAGAHIGDDAETFLSHYRTSPQKPRDLLAIHWCRDEVIRGGFEQFFGGRLGVLAPEAACGLDRIGMYELASVVRDALAFFGPAYPRELQERNHSIARFRSTGMPNCDHPFEDFDTAFRRLADPAHRRFETATAMYARGLEPVFSESPVGVALASVVADRLEAGARLHHEHRDYCGMGLACLRGVFVYDDVIDGELFAGGPTGMVFHTREDFLAWLSQQSDQSLSGMELEEPFVQNNQRITVERLQKFAEGADDR